MVIEVYVELGVKRGFACALDWPGWCRSGRDEKQALETLAAYAPRYAIVAAEAGFPLTPDAAQFEVVDHVAGNGTTDFGAPAGIVDSDNTWVTDEAAERLAELVAASWRVFDRVAAGAPAELRKGPRGGGRDRDKIVEHVLGADTMYARRIGVRRSQPAIGDEAGIERLREAMLEALREQVLEAMGNPWPAQYAARRIAWHVLDHAWEIEDRS
ncbi:MAG TPA: hypothetical protein VK821_05350 [Dehalococcoidia bacterium]|nr:hypothetical protein [Dehalococcoidia bacterium]